MKETKSENCSFRLTPSLKLDLMKKATELGKQPGEYINNLIEKDLASKANDLPEGEKTFLAQQFNDFAQTLLSFFTDKFDKRLLKIEHSSVMCHLTSFQSLLQSAQAAIRTKELLSPLNDEQKMKALDDKIRDRVKAIRDDIKAKFESGEF